MTSPHEIYASELSWSGFGYPMWFPEHTVGGKSEVEIGDVGFIRNGIFKRIFNVCQDRNSPMNKGNTPDTFERLSFPQDLIVDAPRAIQSSVHSRSATERCLKAHADGDTPIAKGEIKYEYTCSQEKAAMLVLKPTGANQRLLTDCPLIREYVKKYHWSWWEYISQVKQMGVQPSEVIFARGWCKTDQWTVAAVDRSAHSHQGSAQVHVSLPSAGAGAGLSLQQSAASGPGAMSRTGPWRQQPPSFLASLWSGNPSPAFDQCVFLPHYRVKYGIFMTIKARAGVHILPDGDEDSDFENAEPIVYTDVPLEASRYPPLDILLDYILNNSTAELAIACEDSIPPLFIGTGGPQIRLDEWLNEHKPGVIVEDGVGTVSFYKTLLDTYTEEAPPRLLVPQPSLSNWRTVKFGPLIFSGKTQQGKSSYPQRGPLRGIRLSRPGDPPLPSYGMTMSGDPPLPSYYDVPLPASRGTAPGRYKLPQRRCTVAPSVVDLNLVRFTGEATPSVRLLDAMKEDRRYLILGKDDAVSRATPPEQKVTFCLEFQGYPSYSEDKSMKIEPGGCFTLAEMARNIAEVILSFLSRYRNFVPKRGYRFLPWMSLKIFHLVQCRRLSETSYQPILELGL